MKENFEPSWGALTVALVLFAGCITGTIYLYQKGLERDIQQRGYITIHTMNSPTTAFEGRDGQMQGFEFDMATQFADDFGVTPHVKIHKSVEEVLAAVEADPYSIGAAGLTISTQRKNRFRFGPSYLTVKPQLLCYRRPAPPREIAQLARRNVVVSAGTTYVTLLQELSERHPQIRWREAEIPTEILIEKVWKRDVDCTIADSNIVAINRRYYPEVEVGIEFEEESELAWALPKESRSLAHAVDKWFRDYERTGKLEILNNRYYGFVREFDYYDTKVLQRRIGERLNPQKPLFIGAAEKYDLPWTLLAAMGYQESQWNPLAESPTGVRGMMMLTENTALSLGVSDRLNAEQSIYGGARYLKRLYQRFPSDVPEKDKIWMSLAAYNVGWGHLKDAQSLLKKSGKNPHLWAEVKRVLPRLADPKYYQDLEHGYARGMEPVHYVERVRNYEGLIRRWTSK